jgi:DNA-binding response OmpR family regulator
MTHSIALIIEDDLKLARIFAEAFQIAGYEVETIQDGRTARDRLAETAPAIVILDLHLPYLSGRDLLYHIRADKRFAQTRVLLTTADPLLADSLREEADMVLIKPIGFSQLLDIAKSMYALDIITED